MTRHFFLPTNRRLILELHTYIDFVLLFLIRCFLRGVKRNAVVDFSKVQPMPSLWCYTKYSVILSPAPAVLSHKFTRLLGRAMAKQLVAGFWPLNHEFDHWPFHVVLTVDNVALRFFPSTSISSLSIGEHVFCNLFFMTPTLHNLSKWQGPSVLLKRRGKFSLEIATPEWTTALRVHKLLSLIFLSVEFSLH
jgi:hypothetical protein